MGTTKTIASCLVAAVLALDAVAGTVYVDNKLSDYTDHDGSSWQMAYRTIQDGVNAASDGDTVLVAPGTYGDDQGKVAAASSYHACRVYISKAITLKSSKGREATHVVGNYVEGASASTDAVGGIVIAKAAAVGTVVQGFTIRGCGTSKRGSNNPIGGAAVYCNLDAATAMSGMPWVADCAIEDCYSYCAAVKYVNVARTSIMHCRSTGIPVAADYCNLAHCVIAHNGDMDVYNIHLLRGTRGEGATANYVINCTIQDNARDRKSTRLNSSHRLLSRMPSSA